ncbi:unnamed protein product [Phytomonas sp. EM1]|nr:unnamed protein product [Phytomonas sp. EM1]|eukprot:CCW63190.1 unnamed protein product [Phytomonas sp. isolate EM1]
MDSLINLHEVVEKLCAFLRSSVQSDSGLDTAQDLFAPRKEAKHLSVEVEVAFLSSPPPHRVPLYILLPHKVMHGTICLITPSPQNKFKDKILSLSEDGHEVAQNVKRVIDAEKLRTKIVDPVSVRAFAKGYDNFVVYAVKKYPPQLTGEFLGHQRLPVWVSKKGPLATSLANSTRTAVVSRRGNNAVTCCIGHTDLSVQQIEENVKTFVEKLTKHPQGAALKNILHIRVAGTNTEGVRVGFPIFGQTFAFTSVRTAKGKRPREETSADLNATQSSS